MGLFQALTRRKSLALVMSEPSQLGKVLSTFDLIALGVGTTLGVGVYLIPGGVARDSAGPGVVLSFFYAAVASMLAGLCYAEFGARVPKAGSAYIYSYVTVGEFIAFIIGWNLIIEYIIGAASVAKASSVYLDALFDYAMADYFKSMFPVNLPFLSEYFDMFAFAISVVVCFGLAVGLKESIILNNLLSTVNCGIVIFVIVLGSFYADFQNWKLPKTIVPVGYGSGGFLPYGIVGTLQGAATCFYGFVGFDVIATSGEEVRNPRRAIPISIIASLFICFLAYSGVSTVLTLMWPYYLQDEEAPIPYVFAELNLEWAKWIVTFGSLFGFGASLFGGLFPLPRIIYSMAQDGLLFEWLGQVHPKFKTPFIGTIVSGVITGFMAAVFSLKHLMQLMSMATLVCYIIVAMAVLILRYRQEGDFIEGGLSDSENSPLLASKSKQTQAESRFDPTKPPFTHVPFMVYLLTFLCILLVMGLIHIQHMPSDSDPGLWSYFCVVLVLLIGLMLACFQGMPHGTSSIMFQVPGLPLTPTISIFLNLYFMFIMEFDTWIRFILWMIVGLLIYFFYGLKHSKANNESDKPIYERLQNSD
ncbi:cationic amino acid transporter 2-like [Macrosteles quadrilineatus]|uniref:cationic amino acid transporter 2-like n=1 Tax=Macrosteles quadrilineatus TaxID=74068 RepID=UPI0023E1FB0E|nr:cationic amino acid transporter 2-like [Macrosteles quadrilineatus]XP_054286521.1 cationic amino acid transporter 2-like [Macrosteles quadrilineatus]